MVILIIRVYFNVESNNVKQKRMETGRYIEYRNTKCKKLVFRISPQSPFQKILSKLSAVEFVGCSIASEHITYSVLELLNNSLRAQREKNRLEPIVLKFEELQNGFHIYLRDWGGGFDVNTLPYNINTRIEEIDIHNEEFEQYRQAHEYMRFGLGLYLARKTFPSFSISFINTYEEPVEWNPDLTAGTVIELHTSQRRSPINKGHEYAQQTNI
jgi:anti-sigma regulatory factor (Ser/Thr protein kinase)